MYTLETLLRNLRPFKTTTEQIKPIMFVMKNEQQVFDSYKREESLYSKGESKRIRESIFLSVVRTHPEIRLLREVCVSIDKKGGIITHLNNVYRPGQSGLYVYNDESIDIVVKWLKGFNIIKDIEKELNRLDTEDLYKIIPYIHELKLKSITGKLEKDNEDFFIYKGVKINETDFKEQRH